MHHHKGGDAVRVTKGHPGGYIEAHRETLAVIILRNGLIDRVYRDAVFPWIELRYGQAAPADSIATGHGLLPGQLSDMEECDPETWLGDYGARQVEVLSEQILAQQNGWATILLHAEMGATDRYPGTHSPLAAPTDQLP